MREEKRGRENKGGLGSEVYIRICMCVYCILEIITRLGGMSGGLGEKGSERHRDWDYFGYGIYPDM